MVDDVTVAVPATVPPRWAQLATVWLSGVMRDFRAPGAAIDPGSAHGPLDAGARAERVLDILGERRFTHLSRTQARPYRAAMLPRLRAEVQAGRRLHFCYDLGPGYHASLDADFTGLRFEPGLGELLALRQILRFAQAVQAWHRPGVHFSLVIDDLCAWLSNDIPTGCTAGYLRRLEGLIHQVGMQDRVAVLPESALLDHQEYRHAFACEPPPSQPVSRAGSLTPAERENVSRFVGHRCTETEARERVLRYQRAQAVSGRLMAPHLGGVRLTQRASATTWGFRSFPGGDGRLQCGEVDVRIGLGLRPRPHLTTHRLYGRCRRWPLGAHELPQGWPLPMGVAHLAWCSSDVRGTSP